jgi:hypothetical protein
LVDPKTKEMLKKINDFELQNTEKSERSSFRKSKKKLRLSKERLSKEKLS